MRTQTLGSAGWAGLSSQPGAELDGAAMGRREPVHFEGKEDSNKQDSAAQWLSMRHFHRESLLISYNSCTFRTRADNNVHKPSKGIWAK